MRELFSYKIHRALYAGIVTLFYIVIVNLIITKVDRIYFDKYVVYIARNLGFIAYYEKAEPDEAFVQKHINGALTWTTAFSSISEKMHGGSAPSWQTESHLIALLKQIKEEPQKRRFRILLVVPILVGGMFFLMGTGRAFVNALYMIATTLFIIALFSPAFIKANGWGANYPCDGWSALSSSLLLPFLVWTPGDSSAIWIKLFQVSFTFGNLLMLTSPLFFKRSPSWFFVFYSLYLGLAVWLFPLGKEGTGIVSFLYGYYVWASSFAVFGVWIVLAKISYTRNHMHETHIQPLDANNVK